MQVRVKLFAAARQFAGSESVEVTLPEQATVADLRLALEQQVPALAGLLKHALFAVNTEYVSSQSLIPPDAEIACIPPVSGG